MPDQPPDKSLFAVFSPEKDETSLSERKEAKRILCRRAEGLIVFLRVQ
jgi:hypothetical protein